MFFNFVWSHCNCSIFIFNYILCPLKKFLHEHLKTQLFLNKYTIRSIVCEASCYSLTQSLGHSVTRSLGHCKFL